MTLEELVERYGAEHMIEIVKALFRRRSDIELIVKRIREIEKSQ